MDVTLRTMFAPFLQTKTTVQPLLKPLRPRFSGPTDSRELTLDVFEPQPVTKAPSLLLGQSPLSWKSTNNGPSLSQTWIRPLNLDLPDTSVHTKVVVPGDALSSQGYQQVQWTHPATQRQYELSRSDVNVDGTMTFTLRSLHQPDAQPAQKRLHVSQLPQMLVIDDFRPTHDMDGDGTDCVSHGEMVLQVARRVNPFGVYHVVQPQGLTLGMSNDLMPADRPVIDALIRQSPKSIRSANFSYGQTVPLPMLGFFLGQEVTLESLPQQAQAIKDVMSQAYRLEYLPFKKMYFEPFHRQAKQFAKAHCMNPADFTDSQIGYDFMFMYDRLREAHLDHKQFKRLKDVGIQPYLSAGNSGSHTISLAALSPDVIVVGGLDAKGDPADFSSSVLPHHPSFRAEFPVRTTPKGINFTDTPDVVDIPTEWLPVTATLMQVGHLLGLPIKDRVFQDADIKELLARSGRRYASRYGLHHVNKLPGSNLPPKPPLSRDDLMIALNTKLLTHPQLNEVSRALGLSQVRLKPIGKYIALAPDTALLQVNVTPEGLTVPALAKPMETLRGTSFSSPAVMARKELDNFVLTNFGWALAA